MSKLLIRNINISSKTTNLFFSKTKNLNINNKNNLIQNLSIYKTNSKSFQTKIINSLKNSIFSQNTNKLFYNKISANFSELNKDIKDLVKFKFVYQNGSKEVPVEAEVGKHILEIAHKYGVDLEGACDASLACSTCHVIFKQDLYDKLPAAKEEEEDLLDLAFGLTHTSRLGCQVYVSKEFEGAEIVVPSATRNLYVDGHKPKPH